jgi:hypothetical protein
MNWKGCGRRRQQRDFRKNCHCLEGMKKITKACKDSRSLGWYLDLALTYAAGLLTKFKSGGSRIAFSQVTEFFYLDWKELSLAPTSINSTIRNVQGWWCLKFCTVYIYMYNLPAGDVTASSRMFLQCVESNFGSQVVQKKKSALLNCRLIIRRIL